jgi:hypothetical protein
VIMVPEPSCVKSSISSAPGSFLVITWARCTLPRTASTPRQQLGRLLRGQLGQKFAFLVFDRRIREKHQFLGVQRRGGGHGYILHRQVEYLAGGGVAHRRDDRNIACIEATRDRLSVDLAHGAGVLKIDPVVHTYRLRGDEISRDRVDRGPRHG